MLNFNTQKLGPLFLLHDLAPPTVAEVPRWYRDSVKQRTEAEMSCGSLWEVTTFLTAVCSEEDTKAQL